MDKQGAIIIVASAITLVVAFVVIVNCLYKKTNAYKNRFVPILGYLNGVPKGLKFAAFGSTYGMFAFNFLKKLNLKAFNFCLPSECIEADLSLLKHYKDCMEPGCVVAINLSACVAMCDRKDVAHTNNDIYSKILRKNNMSTGIGCFVKRLFPLTLANCRQFARIVFDVPAKSDILDSYKFVGDEVTAKKNMERMANGWINMFSLESLKSAAISAKNVRKIKQNVTYMNDFIAVCKECGFKPVFVIPPISGYLNSFFSQEFLKATLYSLIDDFSRQEIPVYDYLKFEDFQNNLSLFQDGGFRLSAYGSKKFMNIFFNDLRKQGCVIDNEHWGTNV